MPRKSSPVKRRKSPRKSIRKSPRKSIRKNPRKYLKLSVTGTRRTHFDTEGIDKSGFNDSINLLMQSCTIPDNKRSKVEELSIDFIFSIFQKLVDQNIQFFINLVDIPGLIYVEDMGKNMPSRGNYIGATKLGTAHYKYVDKRNRIYDPYDFNLQILGGHQFCAIHAFNLALNVHNLRTNGLKVDYYTGMKYVTEFINNYCIMNNSEECNELLHKELQTVLDVNKNEDSQIVKCMKKWISDTNIVNLFNFFKLPYVQYIMAGLG